MFAYCVDELHFSEDAAYKRIRAARAARRLPILFDAVAEGRLHLAAVYLIASHVTPENVEDLVDAATHRTEGRDRRVARGAFPKSASPIAAHESTRFLSRCPRRPPIVIASRSPAFRCSRRGLQGNLDSDCQRILKGHPGMMKAMSRPGTPTIGHSLRVSRGQLGPGGQFMVAPAAANWPRGQMEANSNKVTRGLRRQNPQRLSVQVTVDKATHDKLRRGPSTAQPRGSRGGRCAGGLVAPSMP